MRKKPLITKAGLLRRARKRGVKKIPKDFATGKPFARGVAAIKRKGGAYDPAAVMAARGRKKYGKALFQQMGAYGRRRRRGA